MTSFVVKRGDVLYSVEPEGDTFCVVGRAVVAAGSVQIRVARGATWDGYARRALGHRLHQTQESAIRAFEARCREDVKDAQDALRRAEAGIAWAAERLKRP